MDNTSTNTDDQLISETVPAVQPIVIDDGSVEVPICNRFGKTLGTFYFRPTDLGIIDRYNRLAAGFDDITAPLMDVNIKPDGTTDEDDEAQYSAFKDAEKRLYAACDELFDGNFSEAFFSGMHPFSPIGGSFYCELALAQVGDYLANAFGEELKKINARVRKYTHGYQARTGRHKDGHR